MDAKEINHIAKLARLKFDASGVDSMAKDLNDILKWMDILQSADTSAITDIEETAPLRQREDKVTISNLAEKLMKNATEPYEHFFTVPKVVE